MNCVQRITQSICLCFLHCAHFGKTILLGSLMIITVVIFETGYLEVDYYLEAHPTEEASNINGSTNGSLNRTNHADFISHFGVQAMFITIYATIFVLGIFGNALVCIVVLRNKAMQTVTNFFITNLALADILLNSLVTDLS